MTEAISIAIESPEAGSQPCEATAELGEGNLGHPKWAGCYLLDWEILVYEKAKYWEACFFKWDAHHEHIKGFSLDNARSKAEQKIRILESAALRLVRTRSDSAQGRKPRTARVQLSDTTTSTAIMKTSV